MTVPDYTIRPLQEMDVSAVADLGEPYWWNPRGPTLHLVAAIENRVAAHLHVTNRSLPLPSRREGETEMRLIVTPEHRRRGIGAALFERVKWFAVLQKSTHITASYFESEEGKAGQGFLERRGFQAYERFISQHLDLVSFEPGRFTDAIQGAAQQGVHIKTLQDLGDTPERRLQLYHLESRARTLQPFRKVTAFVPESLQEWEEGMQKHTPNTIFVAVSSNDPIGMIKGLTWGFAGVDPDWHGKGIATALKVVALTAAKERGLTRVYTENHEDNAAMRAINKKLGYVPDPAEVNCILRLST